MGLERPVRVSVSDRFISKGTTCSVSSLTNRTPSLPLRVVMASNSLSAQGYTSGINRSSRCNRSLMRACFRNAGKSSRESCFIVSKYSLSCRRNYKTVLLILRTSFSARVLCSGLFGILARHGLALLSAISSSGAALSMWCIVMPCLPCTETSSSPLGL